MLICVNKKLKSHLCETLDIDNVNYEKIYVTTMKENCEFIIGGIYIPPKSKIDIYQDLSLYIEDIANSYINHKLFIIGDFNLPKIDWHLLDERANYTYRYNTTPKVKTCNDFLNRFINDLGLVQKNNIVNNNENVLDLVFTNSSNSIINKAIDHLVKEDIAHPVLSISLDFIVKKNKQIDYLQDYNFDKYDFNNADYNNLQKSISHIPWNIILENLNIEESVDLFYKKLYEIMDKYIQKKKIKPSTYPKWYSLELKNILIKKKIAHKLYKITKNEKSKKEIDDLRWKCKNKAKTDYKLYINNVENNLKKEPKQFWIYLNDKKSSRELPSIMKYKNNICNNSHDISNLFAEFFNDIYKDGSTNLMNDVNLDYELNLNNINNEIEISKQDIVNSIKKLNLNASVGPDNVPGILIKNCADSLISPLHIIYNKSLRNSCLPSRWKLSYIVPVYKNKGDIGSVKNYRPITIISTIPKLLDCIISEKINNICINKLSNFQHGSIHGKSIQTNLLDYTQFINSKLNINSQVDAIYTDFSKAFDMINHNLLLKKLILLKIPNIIIKWIQNYLENRNLAIRIKDTISNSFLMTNGIPQGSHLSSILFIIFINDIVNVITSSKIWLYLDDIKIALEIETLDDCKKLQKDLNNICDWCIKNGMK